ncbi:primary amine oxidase-like [Prosopis cineraria]|uniref:primary amine oxidase-like n=1 Tax=Prosopis cineraria TaxID=364024 RepID=UPI00240FF031|nr:primary amine oxidase-like [Prosopis cineraria]
MAFSIRMLLLALAILSPHLQAASSASPGPLHPIVPTQHPLDPLTKQEITLIRTVVLNKYPSGTAFHYVGLDDPDKTTLLKWASSPNKNLVHIPRLAFVIVIIKSQIHEILINLKTLQILSDNVHTGNGFPTLTVDEQSEAILLPLKYGPFIESVKKRGLNLSDVVCSTFTVGWYGETKSIRALRVECFMMGETANIYVRPINGILILVDIDKMQIIQYQDRSVEPVPKAEDTEYRADHQKPPFGPKLHGIATIQPEGPGFKIQGHSVSWADWKFHVGYDVRAGVIISLASLYDLDKHKSRRVLYRGYISELFVPYQDPSDEWYYKTFFDAGEFGFGQSMVSLEANRDCPPHAQFMDAYLHDRDGNPSLLQNAFCIFEKHGEISWRHTETGIPNQTIREVRSDVSLVVRSVVTVGNYDNVMDWEFKPSGSLKLGIALSGMLEIKAVDIKHNDEIKEEQHGILVSENSIGVYHDHYYIYHLDLDIDGEENSFVKTDLKTVKVTDGSSKRKSYWIAEAQTLKNESAAMIRLGVSPSELAIVNPNKKTSIGNEVGYRLIPAMPAHPLLFEDDYPQLRGAFTNYNVWVTPYNRSEKWAGGRYVDQSRGEDTLAVWTKKNRNIENKDIVLWHVVGIHHVPAQEDFPIMPLLSTSFELRPTNFFERNAVLKTPSPKTWKWPACPKQN